jgi:hypothetical protein
VITEEQLDEVSFDAFMLAIRVMHVAFDLDEPAVKFEKPFELLREIAAGQLALGSPAELGTKFPALKDLVYDTASSVMERDRNTAGRVLRGLATGL